ncbi:hypothetical protein M3929_002661 [Vibrio metschnikovii]|uniref:hypothetical protein n=1 Tax=Vibrio TaxID=662 RepID=UPI001E638240|nr:hypothetical protein [Vibrio sp. 0908]EKO3621945.1 hypothetical protein [Vibrio metschnikovii]EKO3663354.1 hypothetical protein [Vibrio metschnikovii]
MNPVYVAGGLIGALLLGVVGVQYITIDNLETTIETKTQENAQLAQTNAQFKQDLQESNEQITQMKQARDLERKISADRERELSKSNSELGRKLAQLEKESGNDGKEAACLRTRMPDSVIRMLGGATKNSDGD